MSMDNTLKAIGKTEDELRVGNYIALFGGRDLEGVLSDRVNPDGSKGEFFTKATDFESAYTATGQLYVDWEHGFDAEPGAPKSDDVLGLVDWSTVKADEIGLWAERTLNRRNTYMQFLEELIEAGMIGTSSEAVPGKVEKGADGEIIRWPLKRDTLTVSPMEPRMMTENTVAALKGLAEFNPALKSMLATLPAVEPEAQPEGEPAGSSASAAETGATAPTVVVNVSGDATITTSGGDGDFVATNAMGAEPKLSDVEVAKAMAEAEMLLIEIYEEMYQWMR